MDETRMRSVKIEVENNSKVIDRMVDQIVSKYNRDLNQFIQSVREQLDRKDLLSDEELENIAVKLPLFMYFAASGLESLGIEGDSAKAVKLDVFNQKYLKATGTIQDKTKAAELDTFNETFVEIAFNRAYKTLRIQLDMAEHLFSGIKKVLSKRMQEFELSKKEY